MKNDVKTGNTGSKNNLIKPVKSVYKTMRDLEAKKCE
jgi:hypothetical protein